MHRAVAILVVSTLVACGEPIDFERREQPIRPTESNPHLGIGYGTATAQSLDSAGGSFRVWWAETGVHAPPPGDTSPANGVPDFVDTVASTADAVAELLTADGWRIAKDDTSSVAPDGGDGRFDIYLVDFNGSSDGAVVGNVCSGGSCTAHMLMENDFARSGYASVEEGITVLVSHEYFHAVQYAYVEETPTWWSEGTATWFEEYYEPSQNDFERLANVFFDESDRSLNSRSQGPFDSFSYGVSAFVHCIDLNYGPTVIRDTFAGMAEGAEVEAALDAALADHGGSLDEAFETFAIWNLFTAGRADDDGYPAAAGFDAVAVSELDGSAGANWDVSVDELASRYARFELSGGARISVEAVDGFEMPAVFVARGAEDYDRVDEDGVYVTASSAYVVVANSDPATARAVRVKVRNEGPPAENNDPGNNTTDNNDPGMDDDPVIVTDDDDKGCQVAGSGRTTPVPWFLTLSLLALAIWRRK